MLQERKVKVTSRPIHMDNWERSALTRARQIVLQLSPESTDILNIVLSLDALAEKYDRASEGDTL